MKLQYTNKKRRSRIELRKDERCPLGISVTESQKDTERPIIKNIKHGSIAYKSHSLAEGDVIFSINNLDTRSMRKKDVKRLFKENPLFAIEVEYFSREVSFSKIQHSQRTSLTLKKENGSFGFVVRKGVTEYPLISNIKRDGPADKDGSMMAGDRLLEIDSRSLSWVSLTEVTTLLQEKEEAVFLIEYNVGIVNLSQTEVEMEIDCPDANLGMNVNTFENNLSRMYIATIQRGSLTERCGAFQVGDEILSVYGTDVGTLTVFKVNDLLRRFRKKPGKLKFVPSRKKPALPSKESLIRNNSKTESTADLGAERDLYDELGPENGSYQSISLISLNSSKFSISSNTDSVCENDFFIKTDYNTLFNDNQLKILSVLRCINLKIANLLSSLSRENRNANYLDQNKNQADIINYQEASSRYGWTESKLNKLKVESLSINNLTRELSFHCIKNSAPLESCLNDKSSHSSQELGSSKLPNKGSFVVELVYHLNQVIAYNFVPKTSVQKFIAAINKIDTNCSICRERCYAASFAVSKVLLLLSLNEQTAKAATIAREVLKKVTKICIPCENCKLPHFASAVASASSGEYRVSKRFEASCSSSINSDISSEKQASSFRTKRCETIYEPHVGLDMDNQKAMYRLTDIPSSENSYSTTIGGNSVHSKRLSYPHNPNTAAFCSTVNNTENSSKNSVAKSSKLFRDNQQEKELSACAGNSSWESAEMVSNLQEELKQKFPSVIHRSKTPKISIPEPTNSNTKVTNKTSFGFELAKEPPPHNAESIRQIFSAIEIDESSKQTHTETHNVTLKADGNRGYGLSVGYDSIPRPGEIRTPIIVSIRPKSSAERIGLLKAGDRIIAINGRSTLNSTIEELEIVKRDTFSLDEITLNVEIDVNEPVLKYGTFEVHLDQSLAHGLVMTKNSYPCKVLGLEKGGSAHRSGEIFPGDIVLSFASIRQDSLDLESYAQTKSKTFRIMVKRELDNSVEEVNKPPEFVCDPATLVRKGTCFNLKRTSVGTLEGNEDNNLVFLEQEFTLMRDPQTWDFGFLFGEDPTNGKAYITRIRPNSPAAISQFIKPNDRILEVNGVVIDGSRENSVMKLIMNSTDHITLVTRRILHY